MISLSILELFKIENWPTLEHFFLGFVEMTLQLFRALRIKQTQRSEQKFSFPLFYACNPLHGSELLVFGETWFYMSGCVCNS